jgi:predicted phosphodiesterase
MPLDTLGIDGQRLFNPGSPTERRAHTPHLSFGRLRIDDGRILEHRLVEV